MFWTTSIFSLALAATLTSSTPAPRARKGAPAPSSYRLVADYTGDSFFDHFDTFTGVDPTFGTVQYVSKDEAAQAGLAGFVHYKNHKKPNAFLGVDDKHVVSATEGRKSVRIMSKKTFSVGMLTVVDIVHAPTGPGLWPAIWLLCNETGTVWPNGGEMDILEWVNDAPNNAMTLHSAPGCSVDKNAGNFRGNLLHTDCNTNNGGDGCSIRAPNSIKYNKHTLATAGAGFNKQGGGVFVQEWTTSGVSTWLFPRHALPSSLKTANPDPSTWSHVKPLAQFRGSGCDFSKDFRNMQIIINIDVCGSWAGNQALWTESGMDKKTGFGTCAEYARDNPDGFKEAYFDLAGVRVFASGEGPRAAPPAP